MTEMFPTRMRYSGVSLGYQVTSIFAGSLAPIIATTLLQRYGSWVPVAIYLAIAAGVTLSRSSPCERRRASRSARSTTRTETSSPRMRTSHRLAHSGFARPWSPRCATCAAGTPRGPGTPSGTVWPVARRRVPPGSQSSLREANRARLVESLKRHGRLTQVELAGSTGLSPATVSNIVKELTASGLLHTSFTSRSGRRATLVVARAPARTGRRRPLQLASAARRDRRRHPHGRDPELASPSRSTTGTTPNSTGSRSCSAT